MTARARKIFQFSESVQYTSQLFACVRSLILTDREKTIQEADMFKMSILYRDPGLNSLEKCKLYYRSGNPKPTHKNVIEEGDMKKLSRYFIQQNDGNTSAYESAATTFWTPEILQQYMWFNLCYHFGRRG